MFPCKVISGGQTGADFGALLGAHKVGIPTGGHAQPAFRTERGCLPVLGTKFGLTALTSGTHAQRDRLNVDNSDATLAFRLGRPGDKVGGGTDRTLQYAACGRYENRDWLQEFDLECTRLFFEVNSGGKPLLVVRKVDKQHVQEIAQEVRQFCERHSVKTLNVCGHCESSFPTLQNSVKAIMALAFQGLAPPLDPIMALLQEKPPSTTATHNRQHKHKNTSTNRSHSTPDILAVLDFEATCDDNRAFGPQEIIEFPIVLLDTRSRETLGVFHHYVTPVENARLTAFCTQLTGITQAMVDDQLSFPQVLQQCQAFLRQHHLLEQDSPSFVWVTCGDWDLKTMLPSQEHTSRLSAPHHMRRWCNIKKVFNKTCGVWPRGMMDMLKHLDILHQGRHHSGIDDTKNICAIACRLLDRGADFAATRSR